MDKQATAQSSSTFSSDAVKGHMKKRGATLQAAKRNAALASKIKTKLINNSSMFKVSLKQNNKALAVALSVEKENSRKLKNEKIFLQKEVEKLQLHNILLRRKLNCLNKTLTEIEAFLSDNLLTAIEISSLSETPLSSPPLSAAAGSPTEDPFKRTCQSARSVELPVKLPLTTTASAKQQASPSVCEILNSYKCTTVLSKETHPDQVNFALSLSSGTNIPKLTEIDPVETTVDKNIFLKENQLCAELTCGSAFLTHVKTTPALRQPKELTKQYSDSSVLFCGNVTERKKRAVLQQAKTQTALKDFDEKCNSNNLPLHGLNSSSNTNDMNVQESSSDLSRIIPSPFKFSAETKTGFKTLLFTDKMKPEETVYDADMELTASDAGELLTVTAKDKDKLHQNKNSNAKSDKILANFRKVKYSKKDKEKISRKAEVSSDLHAEERHMKQVSNTTDSQLLQSQTEQPLTENSVGKQSLLNTRKHHQAPNCPSEAKVTERIDQVNLMSPRKQETNKGTFSETSEDMESKIQKADSNSADNKIPPEVYGAENLPVQDNISNELPLLGYILHTNEKCSRPKINRKPFQNPPKMNSAKSCRKENGQYGECISKLSQTEIHHHDSKTKPEQNNVIKRKYNKKISYRPSGEIEGDSIHNTTHKADQKSSHFSPGRLKRTLAKAGRKACIIPKENLPQFSLLKNKELKNKAALHTDAVHGNKATETWQTQVAVDPPNSVAANTARTEEQDDDDTNALKEMDSSTVACKTPHVNNILDDQEVPQETDSLMSKLKPTVQKSGFECSKNVTLNVDGFFQQGLSNTGLPALGKDSASMNFSKLKNFEICPEKGHHEAPGAGKAEQNLDHVCKEAYQKTLTPGHGRTALQDLTNTGEQSQTALCKSPQTSEENSAAPSTRARATICYKEPSISSKLRRGDRFTDTQFLNSPVYKERNKRSFKSKSKFV